jgi:hypothetical protein
MNDSIGPISLPPHLAYLETWMATWNEAVMAATTELFHWWCMPFCEPHHHEAQYRFQMEIPEPFEDDEEQDLFA